jgi:hypothetical protein
VQSRREKSERLEYAKQGLGGKREKKSKKKRRKKAFCSLDPAARVPRSMTCSKKRPRPAVWPLCSNKRGLTRLRVVRVKFLVIVLTTPYSAVSRN